MTAVMLVAAEFATRFVFRHAHSSGNAGDFVAGKRDGPAVVNNSLGFRDREIPPKSPDRYRIAVVGDSFAWGQGIAADERFSNLVGAALGPGYEVFNFGQPGNNMPEHLEVLTRALSISPDFILLQLYINDWETSEMVRPSPYRLLPASLDRTLERSSMLYDLLNRQWQSWQPTLGVIDSYDGYMARNLKDPSSPNARKAYGQLREFVDRARAAGVPTGIVLFPAPDAMGRYGSRYPFGYLHDGVRSICADEHIACLDLLPPFSAIEDPRTMWVSPFDAHPNAMANRRAAKEILQKFTPGWRR